MATKDNRRFMEKLMKLPGASMGARDIHSDVIQSPSPALNFVFGNGQGLPRGLSLLLYGPPRGGKSVICDSMAGQFHRTNPNGWVVKFNTEFREAAQSGADRQAIWGIDADRYVAFEVNQPDHIFDRIETELAALVQDGMDLGLVIIDSINGVQGRRAGNATSIMTQQIGDDALTIGCGLKRILPVQRACRFGLILTTHIRAQMDTKAGGSSIVHTSQSTAVRPGVSFGTQHHCEYFMYVAPAGGADAKKDLLGNDFKDTNLEDMQGNAEKTGHKVRCKMMDSSLGPKGRVGEFTLDYAKGIINTHEEVFLLGVARGIITKPSNVMYNFEDQEWRGKEMCLTALKSDPQLCTRIVTELKKRDMAGHYAHEVPAPEDFGTSEEASSILKPSKVPVVL